MTRSELVRWEQAADGFIAQSPGLTALCAYSGALAGEALRALEVDELGLDEMDTRILTTLIEKFAGGPVGVGSLAVAVGEDAETLEEVHEPFLIQSGFLHRTHRGRVATARAYEHLGIAGRPPQESAGDQPELFGG